MDELADKIRDLSDRLVEAQRSIRILDAVKWEEDVQSGFLASNCRELPRVDQHYYEARPLPFDPDDRRKRFVQLAADVQRQLGGHPAGEILQRTCREYQAVVEMLAARGTPEFAKRSNELFGSASAPLYGNGPTLADFGLLMAENLAAIDCERQLPPEPKNLTGEEAVALLQPRLQRSLPHPQHPVRVVVSDGIVSDAAAGGDVIKLRAEARFNERDLRLLEVHEGWVHLGTTLNGMSQPVCTFLSKGPPSSTVTQEGLAILMENLTFTTHPERLRKVSNRIRAVHLAEHGADFLDVFRFFTAEGWTQEEAYLNTMRVFRGSTPTGQPFTKDVSYAKGFILVYNFIQLAVRHGKLDCIPLLFCGKTNIDEINLLVELVDQGLVHPPAYVPQPFGDLHGLVSWMCYSSFLSSLKLDDLEGIRCTSR